MIEKVSFVKTKPTKNIVTKFILIIGHSKGKLGAKKMSMFNLLNETNVFRVNACYSVHIKLSQFDNF